ncbi:MAG TPA: cytochrome c maturation protein CcmE [Acidimicrobiales bacterium]|nr:cytochrome c maturation protein CcmE [Acidimicrobiales bacterium]
MTAVPTAPRVRPAKPAATKLRILVVVVIVLGAIAFVVFKGLDDAAVYFRTADEAVAEKDELGDQRFRIEGAVVTDSVEQAGDVVEFEIISAGVTVPVVHRGDPPELFKPGIPVVLEGRWEGDVYASDRIMVKHTSEYREQNPERVDTYVGKGQGDV